MQISDDKFIGNDISYIEMSQSNPIRWTIGRLDNDIFYRYFPAMKCRDYFNDVAFLYVNGKNIPENWETENFKQYGFPPFLIPYDEMRQRKKLDILLTNVLPEFRENVEKHLVPFLKEQKVKSFPEFTFDVDDPYQCVVSIPDFYWRQTFRISLLTALIRWCNNDEVFENQNDWLNSEDLSDDYRMYLQYATFYAPKSFKNVVAPVSRCPEYSISAMQLAPAFSVIHNCGYSGAMSKMFPHVNGCCDDDEEIWEDEEDCEESL